MTVFEPSPPEVGKNAMGRRVGALRELNEAGGVRFRRYVRGGAQPVYQITTTDDVLRPLNTREVPAYVLGHLDGYEGVRLAVREALSAALADPDVRDQDSLLAAVLEQMDEKYGAPVRRAASFFENEGEGESAEASGAA